MPAPLIPLVIATTNRDKLREIQILLQDAPVELRSLAQFPDLPSPAEHGATFDENARLKALYYARETGMRAVAEDSGLEIDALGGEPGVRSARFGGPDLSYPERFARIYERLDALRAEGSPARFVCALALADAGRVTFETRGIVEGRIAPEPRGTGGFGYDPIFFYPPYARTLAEVSSAEKLAVAHRGIAFRKLADYLKAGAGTR